MRQFNFLYLLLLILVGTLITTVKACDKSYKVLHTDGLYIVKIDMTTATIKPYVSDKLEIVQDIAEKNNALVAINSGFFDAKNRKTVSYIIENGEILANPTENENLLNNDNLKPHLKQIYNRGELRIYKCNNKIQADIQNHFEPYKNNCTLINSTQAGPIILPDMNLEKEFFVLKENGKIIRDSVGLLRKTDRSLVAIKDNYIYFIITDEVTPMNIYEIQGKLKKYNFDKAMGFDGGGSVSLYVKQKDGIFYQDREEKGASRAVKSALLVLN